MGWPQWVYICMTLVGLGIAIEQHGKPKEGRHSAWVTIFATALVFGLLWKGGFFA